MLLFGLGENLVFLLSVCLLTLVSQLCGIKLPRITRYGRKNNEVYNIPGPVSLPLAGTIWIYLWRYKKTKVHEAYRDMFSRYGQIIREVVNQGVFIVSVSSKSDIEKVLRYPSKYPFRPPSRIILEYRMRMPDKFASAGIANEQGELWHNLRSKLTPELTSKKTMLCFLPELNHIADDFMQLLRQNRDENLLVHKFDEFSCRYGLETTCTLVFGERMTYMETVLSETAQKLSNAMIQRFKSERDEVYAWGDYKKTKDYQKFLKGEEDLYTIVDDIVNKAKQSRENMHVDDVKCILMSIVEKKDVDEREKRSTLIDFVAAGILPLRNTLIFLMYLVAKHPEVQEKAYEELQNIVINSNHMTMSDLSKMVYIKACILESYRLIPVAFGIGRVLEEDIVLSGYNVRAGTYIMCHTMAACLDEKNFTRATEYIPERWIEGSPLYKESQSAATCIFAPFGVGKRMCPGRRFVEEALLVTFAKLIHEFHIEYDGELDVQFEFVLSAKTPVTFKLQDRC